MGGWNLKKKSKKGIEKDEDNTHTYLTPSDGKEAKSTHERVS